MRIKIRAAAVVTSVAAPSCFVILFLLVLCSNESINAPNEAALVGVFRAGIFIRYC